jgi:hypothetical protein
LKPFCANIYACISFINFLGYYLDSEYGIAFVPVAREHNVSLWVYLSRITNAESTVFVYLFGANEVKELITKRAISYCYI